MFFGTPNAGSDIDKKSLIKIMKNLGKLSFVRVPPKIERALELHSDELIDLADEFRRIDICDTKRLQIYSFYESKGTKIVGDRVQSPYDKTIIIVCACSSGWFQSQVVDEYSSRAYASNEEVISVNADHSEIVKFVDENDKTFRTILATVRSLIRQEQNLHQSV
jgi:hypothetical protein